MIALALSLSAGLLTAAVAAAWALVVAGGMGRDLDGADPAASPDIRTW